MAKIIITIFLLAWCGCSYGQCNNCDSATTAWYNQQQIIGKALDSTTRAANTQRAAVVSSLRSTAYHSLQGVTVGATLTATQLQVAAWISLWNAGAVNPATNKVDSLQNNYIH